jgi:poly [ADP-ribose] polymerase
MFGKGVYFADVASKSAQYCGATRGSPGGLLLLCEVALGRVHDLTKAQYMEALPRGRHAVRALGQHMPDPKVRGSRGGLEGV